MRTSRPSTIASSRCSACPAARKACRNFPTACFSKTIRRDSLSVQRFIASAKRLNVPTTKQRRSTGTLASSVNLLLPDALATGNLHDRAQRGRARDHASIQTPAW